MNDTKTQFSNMGNDVSEKVGSLGDQAKGLLGKVQVGYPTKYENVQLIFREHSATPKTRYNPSFPASSTKSRE